jgi:hypothetical protein
MQFLIVFISYLVNTQHVSSDICSSSGVLLAMSCVNSSLHKTVPRTGSNADNRRLYVQEIVLLMMSRCRSKHVEY